MSPQQKKRYIEDLLGQIFVAPLEKFLADRGWDLISWDPEQGFCLTVGRADASILIEFEARDERKPCYARTDVFNACARDPQNAARPLAASERALLDDLVALVGRQEAKLPVFERPSTGRRVALREVRVERMLIPEGQGQYYLNPYVGCMIGCPFCYVQERADFSRHLEGLPQVSWGRWADVKLNAADVLSRELTRYPPGIVRMSPILTDPYQSIERRYRITRQCLKVMLGSGFVPAILTRAGLILEDLDLLRRFPRCLVGFSIPTDRDKIRKIFEPGADPIEDRFAALEQLHRAGLTTVALVQPLLPLDVGRLVDRLAPLVSAVRIDRMYATELLGDLYAKHGLEAYAGDDYFVETEAALRAGFAERGVRVDDMDDLESLF